VIELAEYLDERGRSVFGDWKTGLDPTSRARIQRALLRLEQGNLAALKSVGEGVLEMRLDFGPGFRIYLARDGATLILLLGGGTKHRQTRDIEAAIARWKNYKERKARHAKTNPPAL
jgi:putative addiction module killer protein